MKSKFYTRFLFVLTTILMFAFTATSQTTINVMVSVGEDDVEEFRGVFETNPDGYMDHGSSDLELCTQNENNKQAVGIIFRNVQIPAGSTITNAYVQFTADDDDNQEGPLSIDIWGFKEANTSAPFTADLFNVTSRPKTTATVNWQAPIWAVKEARTADEQTSDIKAIIQEIIDLEGWASGNNLGVTLMNEENGNIHRESEAFEDGAGGPPELFVTYTEGGGGGGEPVTVEYQISESGDDVEEYASAIGGEVVGNMDITSSDLELVFDSETQFVGMIFRSVAVPVGATITNAYVQFQVDAIVPGVTDAVIALEVYGAKEATVAAPFDESPFGVSSHPTTTAKVAWAPGASVAEGDKGVNEQTPDISTVIQEIIGVDGWASGNNMLIVVTGDPAQSENLNREMESFDGDPTGAPKLVITYTEGGGGTRVEKFGAEFSSLIYPNPTEGRLYINNPSSDKFDYEIYTINGRMVRSQQNNTGSNVEVDLSDFVKGMYFVNVRSAERSETHKLILK